jgi:hypothetical protein
LRRFLVAALALLLIPAFALAGKTATEGNQTLRIKSTLDPAKASKSRDRLRPAKSTFDYFAGTTDGSRLPAIRNLVVNLGGPRFFFNAFPTCDETDAAEQGDGVCPDGSQVGRGTGVAEVHSDPNDPSKDSNLEVDVKVYNGSLDTQPDGSPMDPRPGLLLYTEVAGSNVVFPFWGEKRGRQVALRSTEESEDPGAPTLFSIKEVHLTIDRRTVRRDGKRTPFLGLPTRCDGKWVATAKNDFYENDSVTAKHKIRCTEA